MLNPKASLERWLGIPITLMNHEFWSDFRAARASASWTGRIVTIDTAMQLATVWACIRLIAETIATLPVGFYKLNADGSRTLRRDHNLYELLHNKPNADMTAVAFWTAVLASMLAWGNAYVQIVRKAGIITTLLFLLPSRMIVRLLSTGVYEYRYQPVNATTARLIPENELMHIPAFSFDGKFGLSPVAYGCQVFGSAIETEQASANVMKTALRSSGIITMDMPLTKPRRDQIREHVADVAAEGGVMVLEKGSGFQKLGFDPVTLELIAAREHSVAEICRWFGCDPAMVGHGGKDSNWGTGLEQKMLWFLTLTLRKWCVRCEQAIRSDLLTPEERVNGYFAEFNLDGLLRGDSAGRAQFLGTMVDHGLMSRDEGRSKENLPPMGGNAGVLTVQSNMIPLDMLGQNVANTGVVARDAMRVWLDIQEAKAALTERATQ